MSEEQTIQYPSVCLGCKSRLMTALDAEALDGTGEARYECGTVILLNYRERKLEVNRSQKCLEGAPHGKPTTGTPQP